MDDMTELNLDTYARLLAHVACRRGVPMKRILAELGVDAEELRLAEPALRERLIGAWDNRAGILAMKFAAALGAEMVRLGAVGGDWTREEEGPELVVPLSDARPAEPEVPTFLQAASAQGFSAPLAGPASVPEPPPVPSLKGTVDVDLSAVV